MAPANRLLKTSLKAYGGENASGKPPALPIELAVRFVMGERYFAAVSRAIGPSCRSGTASEPGQVTSGKWSDIQTKSFQNAAGVSFQNPVI